MARAYKIERPVSAVARYVSEHPLPTSMLLSTADELMAYGALRAAQMSASESPEGSGGISTLEVATQLRQAPRCSAAVAAGGYLGVALSVSRETAYAMIRTIFVHVPFRSDLHPVILVVAGRVGLIVEPRWLSWAVARSTVEPAITAGSLISAAHRAFGKSVARELWTAFIAPILDAPVVEVPVSAGAAELSDASTQARQTA